MYRFPLRLLCLLLLLIVSQTQAARLKEIAEFKGAEGADLIGYGIVVGLDGTGDGNRSMFTIRSVENMLRRFGITLEEGQIKPKNVAAVTVTARIPAFAHEGDRIDVTVSSIGDASSLMGGVLLMTPLTNRDGQTVVARAQGPVSIGGFNFAAGGSSIRKNYTLVGRVPLGATIEVNQYSNLVHDGAMLVSLHQEDFTNARRVSEAINTAFGEDLASALNAGMIRVQVPGELAAGASGAARVVEMASIIENLEIDPDVVAKVVINERTGTVVVGSNVALLPVAVAHGSLSVVIKSTNEGQQLGSYSSFSNESEITVSSEEAHLVMLDNMANVNGVARALNTLGVSPRDIISIFQLLKEAGALQAELVII